MAERMAIYDNKNLFISFSEGKMTEINKGEYIVDGDILPHVEQVRDNEEFDHSSRITIAITQKDGAPYVNLRAISPVIKRNNYHCYHITTIEMHKGKTEVAAKGFMVFRKMSGKIKTVPMKNERTAARAEEYPMKILSTLMADKHHTLTQNAYNSCAFDAVKSKIGVDIVSTTDKEEIRRLRNQQSIYQFYFDENDELKISEYTFTTGPIPVTLTF